MRAIAELVDFPFGKSLARNAKKSFALSTSWHFLPLLKPELGSDLRFDFHVHAGRQIEFHERIDCLLRWLEDIQKPLVSSNFELLAGLLVYMRASENAIFIDHCWKGNGAAYRGARSLRGVHDFPHGLIENAMIKSFEFNPNLVFHFNTLSHLEIRPGSSPEPHVKTAPAIFPDSS